MAASLERRDDTISPYFEVSASVPPCALRVEITAVKPKSIKTLALAFWADETGATAIEYGLIITLISVVIITAVTTIGSKLGKGFSSVATKLP